MRPNGGWSSSGTQNMQASIGQYSMQAGEPAQPVQQSVVMARIRGFFFRVALPSPTDIGQCFSMISNIRCSVYLLSFQSQDRQHLNIAVLFFSTIHGDNLSALIATT